MANEHNFTSTLEEILESAQNLLENAHKESEGKVSYEQCKFCGLWKNSFDLEFCENCSNGSQYCKTGCMHRCTCCKHAFCMECIERSGTYSGNNGMYFPELKDRYECPRCG